MKYYDYGMIAVVIIAIVCCIAVCWGFWHFGIHPYLDPQYVTIKGQVTGVETILDDDGSIDYLLIEFDDEEPYKVKRAGWNEYIDLTANSYLIIELVRYPHGSEPDDIV